MQSTRYGTKKRDNNTNKDHVAILLQATTAMRTMKKRVKIVNKIVHEVPVEVQMVQRSR